MFRLLLALSLIAVPAFAKGVRHKKPVERFDCCEATGRTPDEDNFYRKQRQASEYQAKIGQAQEARLIRGMADQYAGRISSETGISRLGFSSARGNTYYYRGGGWDCRVSVGHGVTSQNNDCRDTFRGSVYCTSGTQNVNQTYTDQTARLLEQNGRCYQPGYGFGYDGY